MAIIFDAKSNGQTGSGGPGAELIISHTIAADANFLVVGVVVVDKDRTINYVKWGGTGGTALTPLTVYVNGTNEAMACIYYLANPSTGTNNIAIQLDVNDLVEGFGSSWKNVDTDSPVDDDDGATGNAASNTLTMNFSGPGVAIDCCMQEDKDPMTPSLPNVLYNTDRGTYQTGAQYRIETSGGNYNVGWTFDGADVFAHACAVFKEKASSSSSFSSSSSSFSSIPWDYEQTFNELNTGQLNGQDNWGNDVDFLVGDYTPFEGSKCVRIDQQTGIIGRIVDYTDGSFYISCKKTATGNEDAIILYYGLGIDCVRVYFETDGDISLYDFGTSNRINFGTWNINTWHRIGIDFNISTRKYRCNIDNGSWSDYYDMESDSVNPLVLEISVQDNSGQFYFDYISPNYSISFSSSSSSSSFSSSSSSFSSSSSSSSFSSSSSSFSSSSSSSSFSSSSSSLSSSSSSSSFSSSSSSFSSSSCSSSFSSSSSSLSFSSSSSSSSFSSSSSSSSFSSSSSSSSFSSSSCSSSFSSSSSSFSSSSSSFSSSSSSSSFSSSSSSSSFSSSSSSFSSSSSSFSSSSSSSSFSSSSCSSSFSSCSSSFSSSSFSSSSSSFSSSSSSSSYSSSSCSSSFSSSSSSFSSSSSSSFSSSSCSSSFSSSSCSSSFSSSSFSSSSFSSSSSSSSFSSSSCSSSFSSSSCSSSFSSSSSSFSSSCSSSFSSSSSSFSSSSSSSFSSSSCSSSFSSSSSSSSACPRQFGENWQRKSWYNATTGYYWRSRYDIGIDSFIFEYSNDLSGDNWAENINARIDCSGFNVGAIDADFTVRGKDNRAKTTIHYSDGIDTWIAESNESSAIGWSWINLTKVFDGTSPDWNRKVNLCIDNSNSSKFLASTVFYDDSEGTQYVICKVQKSSGDITEWKESFNISDNSNTDIIWGQSGRGIAEVDSEKDEVIFVYKEGTNIKSQYIDKGVPKGIQIIGTDAISVNARFDLEHTLESGIKCVVVLYIDSSNYIKFSKRESGISTLWSTPIIISESSDFNQEVLIVEHGNGLLYTIWRDGSLVKWRQFRCIPEAWSPILENIPNSWNPSTQAVINTITCAQLQGPDSIPIEENIVLFWIGQIDESPCELGWGVFRNGKTQIYSRNKILNLPVTDDNLDILFTDPEYVDVATDDDIYVQQCARDTLDPYGVFVWKNKHSNNTDIISSNCILKTSIAPSINAVYLQIFNRNSGLWETLDSNNITTADTEFTLSGIQSTNLDKYYDGEYWVAHRIYQKVE